MTDRISGSAFKQMITFGAACVTQQKQAINDLNVFPVPDGDTGTNMSLTIQTAVNELKKSEPATVGEAAKITAGALLRGARGNSGVILSLLFRGLSKSVKGLTDMDGAQLAAAMAEGVTTAYGAVMKPAEGTVLTVSRLAAARAVEAAQENPSAEYVMEQAIAAGYETLAQTIDMNPVLKKAGVVDAGGKGYLIILDGMLRALRGEALPQVEEDGEKGTMAIGRGLTFMAGKEDSVNYFLRRAIHTLYTLIFCVMLVAVMVIYILGDVVVSKMLVRLDSVERFQLVDTVANILSIVKIAFAPTVLFGVMIVAYWALPVERVRIKTAVPGAAFTTILWMLLSFGVSSYINIVGINTYMYGSLASVILLALWLYMCMYVMLIGAEINKFMDNGIRGIRRRAHKAGRKKRRLERKKKRAEKRRMRKNRHLKMDEEVDVEVDK